ncbi:DNA polymerase III subunit chi [Roseateles sp.]|uniref:DNA polymerase III subunit chi n=1 Tax=Roseateles sp. TaxID=1971397 RepID=UPI003BA5BD95
MTELTFHTGVPDRLAYVCRLLRKAQLSGARVGVCGSASVLQRLDLVLWEFEVCEFIPHLLLSPGPVDQALLEATPILLTSTIATLPHREVLLNLGLDLPEGFEQYQRVLEVVSKEPEQVQAGRRRYKHYEALGYPIQHHKVSH